MDQKETVAAKSGCAMDRRRESRRGSLAYWWFIESVLWAKSLTKVSRKKSSRVPVQGLDASDNHCENDDDNATWLILPVVVCLSRRLSHACKVQAPICEGETANGSLNQSQST